MANQLLEKVEASYVKRNPDVRTGDTVRVHLRIVEAGKERIQVFEGVVISVSGVGLSKSITVRKISYGVGVEKILPINASVIKKIDIVERGDVRRSKLYYMRKAVGKRSLDAGSQDGFERIMEEEAGVEPADVTSDKDASEGGEEVEASTEETKEEPAGTASSDKVDSSDAAAPADEDADTADSKDDVKKETEK